MTDPQAWHRFALDVHADHGVPDVLVNNAGIVVGGRFLDYPPADWDRQLGVNLIGVIHGCREFGRLMVERGRAATARMQRLAERLPFDPFSPDLVAFAVVRAVRFDLAVVPVRPEAWLFYLASRFAPQLNRMIAAPFIVDRTQSLLAGVSGGSKPASRRRDPHAPAPFELKTAER